MQLPVGKVLNYEFGAKEEFNVSDSEVSTPISIHVENVADGRQGRHNGHQK